MFRSILYFSFLAAFLCSGAAISAAQSQAAVNLFYVRHAESLGNVTHVHSSYNDNTLSGKGNQQAAALTRKLDAYHFDHIIVSPKHRALKTIMPYLKKHGLVAEVWPELDECCWQKSRYGSSSSRPGRGDRIVLDANMKPYFKFSHSEYEYKSRSYGDGIYQLLKATDLIKHRFAGSGKNILMVGHYHAGSRIFELLQGLEPDGRYKLRNAKINHLQETGDGSFRVINFNQ